jgi:hypothetical protein
MARKDKINIPLENVNLEEDWLEKKTPEQTPDIFLSVEQLEKIRNINWKQTKKINELIKKNYGVNNPGQKIINALKKVSSLFLVGCNCGYRISDLKNYRQLYLESGKWYFMDTSEKTIIKTKIPVFESYVVDIFRENKNNLNIDLKEHQINQHLKTIGELAGLTDKVPYAYENIQTGQTMKETRQIFDLIKTSTCRRTWASNMILHYRLPISVAMAFTGHNSEEAFKMYVRLQPSDYADLALEQQQMMEFYRKYKNKVSKLKAV